MDPQGRVLLVLIEQAQSLEKALLVRGGETDERLKEVESEVQPTRLLGYLRFLLVGRAPRPGISPVRPMVSSSFHDSR